MRILLGVTFLFVLATAIPTPRRGKGSRHDGIEVVEEPDRYALAKGVGFWTVAGGSLWLGQRVIRQRMRRQRIKAECIEAARSDIVRRLGETDEAYHIRLAEACDARIETGLWPDQQISSPSRDSGRDDEDGESGNPGRGRGTPRKPKPKKPKSPLMIDVRDVYDMVAGVGRNVAGAARKSFRIGSGPQPPPRRFTPTYAGFR